jgi:hypothetical protein
MKKLLQYVWDFLVAWGEYRAQMAKKRNYMYY